METQKTKVKVLDVVLQVLIAILSLAWIGLYLTYFVAVRCGLYVSGHPGGYYFDRFLEEVRYYPERVALFIIGFVFSVTVMVFVVALFRSMKETAVRGLFTFGLVVMAIHFVNNLYALPQFIGNGSYYRYGLYGYYSRLGQYDFTAMILALLMLCFVVARQKQGGMFVGQIVCLILMVLLDLTKLDMLIGEYDEVYPSVVYLFEFFALWCFYLMMALLSIWLRRKYCSGMQTEAVPPCPFVGRMPAAESILPVATDEPDPDGWFDPKDGWEAADGWLEPEDADEPETVTSEQEEKKMESPISMPLETETVIAEEEVSAAQEKAVRKCSNCGAVLEEGDVFCCECGTKVME